MLIRLLIMCAIVLPFAGCGGGPEIKPANQQPRPTQTPTEREISGAFNVTGSAANGLDPYTGSLTITNLGDVYEYRWSLTSSTRLGVGVQIADATAASFSSPGGGKGCGVVLYKIAGDATMDGRTVRWGENKVGTEKASRIEGSTFAGKYSVSGTAPDGAEYTGTLEIKKDGEGYDLEWKTGSNSKVAFGTWQGSYAAASFGGRQCSFAFFRIIGGRDLEGVWGGQKAVTLGSEKADRR